MQKLLAITCQLGEEVIIHVQNGGYYMSSGRGSDLSCIGWWELHVSWKK